MKFKDKTVVVTGSRRGIGLGIALEFAKLGANVVLMVLVKLMQKHLHNLMLILVK